MLTNVKIRKQMDLFTVPPLDDVEVDERMRHFEQLIYELEWNEVRNHSATLETDCNKIQLETKEIIAGIDAKYTRKETEHLREYKVEIVRLQTAGRLKLLDEMDKHVTDVILAVYHRLGRIDHHEHKRAYKRILYALIVQALCRLLEPEAVLIFRVADVAIGKTVIAPAQAKYKEITGLEVVLQTDPVNFLPLESCGGVNVTSTGGDKTVTNTLAGRLDNLLFKINPVIRIVLFGSNETRKFFDLSNMCGSVSLFRNKSGSYDRSSHQFAQF